MTCIKLPYKYTPRDYQKEAFNALFVQNKKRLLIVTHRRSGKTKNSINLILGAAMRRVGSYYHAFPELKQARKAVWHGMDKTGMRHINHIPESLIKGEPNNTDMRIELINGSSIQLVSSDRYNNLVGGGPAGILFDEYSLQHPLAWHHLSPILEENDGWAIFVYTPRGHNHGYDLYNYAKNDPDWFVQYLTVNDTKDANGNRIISEESIERSRRSGMPEELIQQEYYCSFDVSLVGAFYSKEFDAAYKENRIRTFDIDRNFPVHSAWDLGFVDATAIWLFQVIGHEFRFFKYYEDNGCSLNHYLKWIEEQSRLYRFRIGHMFWPHDADHPMHKYGTGKSFKDLAFDSGWRDITVTQMLSKKEGIDLIRNNFPRFIFHAENCEFGIRALKEYCSDSNGKPIHNWASHGADALRTFMMGWYDYMKEEQPLPGYLDDDW